MAHHADFALATDTPIDFCESHSPCQRGSNAKTNFLFRQYLLKGTDPSEVTRRAPAHPVKSQQTSPQNARSSDATGDVRGSHRVERL
jgi:IS30 family transposase